MNSFYVWAAGLFLAAVTALAGAAPTLKIGNAEGKPGNTIEVPILFENNGNVSGVQFSLGYDSNVLSDQGTAGGESIGSAMFKAGTKAVLIADFSGSPVADGEVAVLYIQIAPEAEPGNYSISPLNVLFSDFSGNQINASPAPSGGTITVH